MTALTGRRLSSKGMHGKEPGMRWLFWTLLFLSFLLINETLVEWLLAVIVGEKTALYCSLVTISLFHFWGGLEYAAFAFYV